MNVHRVVALLLAMAATAAAHDMYLMPSTFFPADGAAFHVAIHVGDSFPESEVAGRLERFQEPKLLWKSGAAGLQNLRVDGKRLLGDAVAVNGEMIVAVRAVLVLIELEPAKFTAYLKEEGLTEVIAWREQHGEYEKPGKERYSKYAKALLLGGNANGFGTQPLNHLIEIVPEVDPYGLKAGDALPIQVLFRGKPAAGLQVESAWAGPAGTKAVVAGRTGSDGRMKVRLSDPGRWRIHTISMERCAKREVADWESFWASLTFAVKEQ